MEAFDSPEAIRVWLRENLRGAWSLPRVRRVLAEAGVPDAEIAGRIREVAAEKWRWTTLVVAGHWIGGLVLVAAAVFLLILQRASATLGARGALLVGGSGLFAIGNGIYILKNRWGLRMLARGG